MLKRCGWRIDWIVRAMTTQMSGVRKQEIRGSTHVKYASVEEKNIKNPLKNPMQTCHTTVQECGTAVRETNIDE